MATSYELIDFETGNLVGSYATEEEARAVVRRACDAEGQDAARGLGLLRVQDGAQELVATNRELVLDTVAAANQAVVGT